jgi:DNA polymerase III sliding clamp (beta) subunit (PCNA family)
MKKDKFTESKAENNPTGGVLVGKRQGQTIIHDKGTLSGYLVGKTHAEGGIKAINKSTGQPLEMQGGEVVITAPAVSDNSKHNFDGEMLTNRQILSKINERGGGVAFAQDGMEIPKEIKRTGASYNFGGKTMTDHEIVTFINGGYVSYKDKYNRKYKYKKNTSHSLEEISKDTGISLKGLQQIYNKGIGAYKTNPSSVRPNVKSKEQWAMARVYSSVMGGKASKVDANELKMNNGGYLSNLSEESSKLIDSNYNSDFGFYDFDYNKESQREDYFDWLNNFMDSQFQKNLNYVISLIDEDIELLEKREESEKKLQDFEELILPTLGDDVKNPALTKYQEIILMNPDAFDSYNLKETQKALSDKGIFNEDGSINEQKISYSKLFDEEGINLPAFEDFVEKNPEFQGVFNHWKKLFDESMRLSIQSTHAFRYPSIDDLKMLKEELSNLDQKKYADGGKVNLVSDSKKGDHTSRDLNNYNDLLDVGADGQVGMDNGLAFANGGLIAPNGHKSNLTPEQYKLVRTPEFKEWFGDWENSKANSSKVVDSNGEPMVVYHTTSKDFTIFDKKKSKEGFFFSPNKERLEVYNKTKVDSYFLRIVNPSHEMFKTDLEYLKAKMYDGIMDYGHARKINEHLYEIVAFEPNQIKLADGNNKNFDNMNPDIRFDDGGDVDCYADGGATLSAEVFEWDKVPANYKNTTKVKKVPFINNPLDKGLDSIIAPFLGKDILRPVMSGINFDENGITGTNAHILITLPYPNKKYEGVYDVNKAKKEKSDELLLINENYPKYQAVISKREDAGIPYQVDVYKLLQYTKTAMNYANKTTYAISFKFGENEAIGFNGKYLSIVLTTALKLGHEKIYVFIQTKSRAVVISPNKNYELGNDEILLTMPVMLMKGAGVYMEEYGANDVEYDRSLKAYFDFNDNEIHNADGSVAQFKMQYEKNSSVDDSYLALLTKITRKNHTLPILNHAKVQNGKMTATDLDVSLIIKDVNIPDGIYEIVNKAPNITMNPIEDFPRERVFDKDEYTSRGNSDTRKNTSFQFITFSEVFEFYLEKLLLSVGNDDLRPVMSGICIKKTWQNQLFLVSTNAHTMCKINITEYCEFNKDDRELEYILPVNYLKDFVKLADGSLHFKCSLSNIFIEAENLEFIARAIDGKYPNYEAVIPKESYKKLVFDYSTMNNCLKSEKYTSLLAKYKNDKDIIYQIYNSGDKIFISANKKVGSSNAIVVDEVVEFCSVDINYSETYNRITENDSIFLLMPVMADKEVPNRYFAFSKYYFDVMLKTITDTEVECYFTEPNRAYIFPIDAIDYKKTLPVEKKKQQKLSKADVKMIEEMETIQSESNELQDAIETLIMLLETAKGKDKREIKEALEILQMLNENN